MTSMSVSDSRRVIPFIPPYISDKLLEAYKAEEKEASRTEHKKTSKAHSTPDPVIPWSKRQADSNKFMEAILKLRSPAKDSQRQPPTKRPAHSNPSPREVWDASTPYPKPVQVLPKGDPQIADGHARHCYANMATVDNFFKKYLGIYPVNIPSKLMKVYVHHKEATNNAAWDPNAGSVFIGDVDPQYFKPFVENLTVITHEFSHAVVRYYGNLPGLKQDGSLDESIADVFAISIKHFHNDVNADSEDADWRIGEDLVVNPPLERTAIRSMDRPGSAYENHKVWKTDIQPSHMCKYDHKAADQGNVHVNCGIPNLAFCEAAKKIGGPTWKTATIWYEALLHTNQDDFATFAGRTLQATKDLNLKVPIYDAVASGWQKVGVDLRGFREEGKRDSLSSTSNRGIAQETQISSTSLLTQRNYMILGGVALLGVVCTFFAKRK